MVKMSKRQKFTLRREFDSTQLRYVPFDTCIDWIRNRCLIFVKLCVKSQYIVDKIIAVQMKKKYAFDVKLDGLHTMYPIHLKNIYSLTIIYG